MTNPVSEWIKKASAVKEPIAESADAARDLREKINWLLLASALQQGINLCELQKFISVLQKDIRDIAELPAPAESLILNAIAKCKLRNWSLASQAAGVVWSVGRFARARDNRLDSWAQKTSQSDIWSACADIFYMGKSTFRPKALAFLFRLSFFLEPAKAGSKAPLPNTAGARRWLIQAKRYDASESPKEKLMAANSLYKELCPKNPALACHALQLFAEPFGEDGFFCQRVSPCGSCLVSSFCGQG